MVNLSDASKARGSFGIPNDVREAAEKAKEKASKKVEEDFGFGKEEPQAPIQEKPVDNFGVEDLNPTKMLERIGLKFTEDDFQSVLFKGVYTATVDLVKTGKLHLTATVKTLTGTEFDMVDELLAEEAERIKMTNDGFSNRRSKLTLAFGVTQLQGKPIVKSKSTDPKELALEKRKVLLELSPAILNRLAQIHGTITTAINLIVSKPDDHLKNS